MAKVLWCQFCYVLFSREWGKYVYYACQAFLECCGRSPGHAMSVYCIDISIRCVHLTGTVIAVN